MCREVSIRRAGLGCDTSESTVVGGRVTLLQINRVASGAAWTAGMPKRELTTRPASAITFEIWTSLSAVIVETTSRALMYVTLPLDGCNRVRGGDRVESYTCVPNRHRAGW